MHTSRLSPFFMTLALCLTSACAEVDDAAVIFPPGDAETGELEDLASSTQAESESGEPGGDASSSDTEGSTSGGEEAGEDETPTTRITALWTESEGTFVRALPGEALSMRLPQVAEVAAFFPGSMQALEDDAAYISLLDENGDALMATRVRGRTTHPDGFAVEAGTEMAYFSAWSDNLPIGFCVTEPCPFYPWNEAPHSSKMRLGGQMWIDGEVAGHRFYAHYIEGEGETMIVEEKGFEYTGAEDLADFKRAEAAVHDLAELSVQVSEHPQATADADPCEFVENAAQGAAAAGGAACCAETGGFGCFFCFAATQTLVEWIEDWC